MMVTTRYRFEKVMARRKVKTFCTKCRKKLMRMVTEFQTISPFNTRKDGRPKTYVDIYAECEAAVAREAKQLEKCGTKCRLCE